MRPACLIAIISTLVVIGCSEPLAPTPQSTAPQQPSTPSQPDVKNSESNSSVATHEDTSPTAQQPLGNALNLYRKSQSLMNEGKHEEGYETAKQAMQEFVAQDDDLPWIMLESIPVGDKRVDVHFNMSERERQMPDDGIVRPLSFRIWSAGNELLQVIDFEIGRSDGESITAAIGETNKSGHANYGILDVDSPYTTVRQRVLDLISQCRLQ